MLIALRLEEGRRAETPTFPLRKAFLTGFGRQKGGLNKGKHVKQILATVSA